jgi:hypothetical protein
MMKRFYFAFTLSILFSLNAANAANPSKTDVIQCGIDAGSRQGIERSVFVEGCLTVKYAAQEAQGDGSGADSIKVSSSSCKKLAESKQGTERKAFVEGCSKAKKDLLEQSKKSVPVK